MLYIEDTVLQHTSSEASEVTTATTIARVDTMRSDTMSMTTDSMDRHDDPLATKDKYYTTNTTNSMDTTAVQGNTALHSSVLHQLVEYVLTKDSDYQHPVSSTKTSM